MYNTDPKVLKKAVQGLVEHSLISRIFLVDNSSSPLDLSCLGLARNKIEYIFNDNNIGFGAAHNVAINTLPKDSKYHLILNPDVCFEGQVIDKLYDYMEQNKGIGLLMPKVLYLDGSIQYLCKLLPSPADLLLRRFIPDNKFKRNRNEKYELRFSGYDDVMDIPSLSGCFMFVRTSILKELNGFDERFFMYMEDVDLCRRIRSKGRTVYYPKVKIHHCYHKGSYKNIKLLFYHIVSAIKYFNKWGWLFDKDRNKINKDTINNIVKQL